MASMPLDKIFNSVNADAEFYQIYVLRQHHPQDMVFLSYVNVT